MAFLSRAQLAHLPFRRIGRNVSVSDRASFHGLERISIGDDTRIDDFCVISAGAGGIEIGSHVHIAVMVTLIGAATIRIEDFVGLAARTTVLSSTDDFSGEWLTGPTIPDEFKRVTSEPVVIGRHVVVGAGSVVLPGSLIGEGAAVGALSLVRGPLAAFHIHAGVPARSLKPRSTRLLELENSLREYEAARSGSDAGDGIRANPSGDAVR